MLKYISCEFQDLLIKHVAEFFGQYTEDGNWADAIDAYLINLDFYVIPMTEDEKRDAWNVIAVKSEDSDDILIVYLCNESQPKNSEHRYSVFYR